MMFNFVSSMADLSARLQRFMMTEAATLPDFPRNKLIDAALHPSPVDRVVTSAEVLWSVRQTLSDAGRELAAQLAQFAAMNGFHDMQVRGVEMVSALCRDAGFEPAAGQNWPTADMDPPVLESMIELVEDEAVEAPAEGEQPGGGQ